MFEVAITVALILAGGAAGFFIVMAIGINYEDAYRTPTDRPAGPATAGIRRILRLTVDHAGCRYATHHQHAAFDCATCADGRAR